MKMITYHGSPHQFARFSLSFMGTGEGFQAFGMGIYLADTIQGASIYSSGWRMYLDGKLIQTSAGSEAAGRIWSTGNRLLDNMLQKYTGDVERLLLEIRDNTLVSSSPPGYLDPAEVYALEKPVEALLGRITLKRSAYLYTVEFDAEDSELIDLDLPLAEQPAAVREVLEPAVAKLNAWGRLQTGPLKVVAAMRASRKHGRSLESQLFQRGLKGSVRSDSFGREFVAYSTEDLTIKTASAIDA